MYRSINRFTPGRLMFAVDTAETGAGPQAQEQGNADQSTAGDAQQGAEGEGGEAKADDLASKFEAQQKVNRDLERKYKDALKKADRLPELEQALAKFEGKEAEYAEAQKAREAEQAALKKADQRILKAEVKAAAAQKLRDPADALAYIDLSSFEVGDDGDVDADAISAAIDDLVTRKPYLAAEGGRRFQGSADGGTRKESRPAQLTRADLARMSPDQIVQADAEGRLSDIKAARN